MVLFIEVFKGEKKEKTKQFIQLYIISKLNESLLSFFFCVPKYSLSTNYFLQLLKEFYFKLRPPHQWILRGLSPLVKTKLQFEPCTSAISWITLNFVAFPTVFYVLKIYIIYFFTFHSFYCLVVSA